MVIDLHAFPEYDFGVREIGRDYPRRPEIACETPTAPHHPLRARLANCISRPSLGHPSTTSRPHLAHISDISDTSRRGSAECGSGVSSRLLPREQVTAEDIRTYQMSEIAAFKDSVAAALGGAGLAYSVVMGGGPFLDTSQSLPGTV